ncbi:hypothetical protein L9F63_024901 [Diploptera punctata]|uniref:Uncharacterized protein n=1 Tax=Diploptera punctata TaxID=6984 RepID=A0AAD7ZFJ7_DIPPU|nr:hypothetical protein L9F63_024901 [Diploptera punctata]
MYNSVLLLLLVCASSALTETENADWSMGTLPPRPASAWNATWTDRLKRDLLANYDKFARPAQHTNTTTLKLSISIRHIIVDDLETTMTVQGWMRMIWNDDKLKWNDSDYGGLELLHVANHEIWQPDVVLYNSATANILDNYGEFNCLVYPNGEVLWVPLAELKVFCDMDFTLWPFDTQTCNLTLGSWTYDGDKINLVLLEHHADMQLVITNNEWEITEAVGYRKLKTYACCPEPYPEIQYKITVRRRSPAYSAVVITPTTVIVLMTLASFWLPPTAGEKIILNACTAMIICIFLLYFAQKLPAMANHTPFVVLFYSSSLYMVCTATIVSVVVMNLARNRHATPLPWIMKKLLTGWVGHILGLGHLIVQATPLHHNMITGQAEELREHQTSVLEDHDNIGNSCDDRQMINPRSRATSQYEWILLAAVIDRITFLVYCFLFAVLAIAYAV